MQVVKSMFDIYSSGAVRKSMPGPRSSPDRCKGDNQESDAAD